MKRFHNKAKRNISQEDLETAQMFIKHFKDIANSLNIKYWSESHVISTEDLVDKILQKITHHPSIIKIKNLELTQKFRFSQIEPLEVKRNMISFTKTKTSGSIPRLVLKNHAVKPLYSGYHEDLYYRDMSTT